MSGGGKKTKGRQKIEMKRIENEDDRLITFSKRRSGIYKKASELVTLCGAEVGFVVFSPAGKPFSFGHPSVEAVTNRFLNQNQQPPPPNDSTHPIVEAHRKMRITGLNQQYNKVVAQLEVEKERAKLLEQRRASREGPPGWWEEPVDGFGAEELQHMGRSLEELKNNLYNKLNERINIGAASSSAMVHGGLMEANAQAQMMMGDAFLPSSGNEFAGPSGFSPQGFSQGGHYQF